MSRLPIRLAVRASLVAALALGALPASAQGTNERTDPANVARARAHSVSVAAALTLVANARDAMRERRFDRVHELCDVAMSDLFELGGKAYTKEAHEVLAEAAVLQGQWIEALRQADACETGQVVQRFAMTKALALIGVGRTAEARAIVLGEIGTPERPGFFRQMEHIDNFPIDQDASTTALKATVHLIRSAWLYSAEGYPEAMDDMKATVALVPRDPTVRLVMGRAFQRLRKYDEAEAEYAKAAALGDKDIVKKVLRARLDIFKETQKPKAVSAGAKIGP